MTEKKRGALLMVEPHRIDPNPAQPRREFDEAALLELSRSIASIGLIQPLSVRALGGGRYQLIAGERRLRAAVMAGLEKVPCVLHKATPSQSGLMALAENLQRRDLNVAEEAEAIAAMMELEGLTQQQVAARLGLSQSAVANKLRILKLTPAARRTVVESGLGERRARALLTLPEALQAPAAAEMAKRGLSAEACERYAQSLLHPTPQRRVKGVVRDVRLFFNTVEHALTLIRRSGITAQHRRTDYEDHIEYLITIHRP